MNEKVPDDYCKPAFKFLMRNCSVKGIKIERLHAIDKVEIGRI